LSRPVRILHCIPQVRSGGVRQHLRLLLEQIDRRRFVNVVCCQLDEQLDTLPADVEVHVHPTRFPFDIDWGRTSDLIQSSRPDIVHAWNGRMLAVAGLPARLAGVKAIVGSYQSAYPARNARMLFYHVGCASLVHRVVANLPASAMNAPYRWIFRWKGSEVIPNGIDVPSIRDAAPIDLDQFGVGLGRPTILFVGRLITDKNLPVLMRAVALLSDQGIEARLLICGTGGRREELERYAEARGIAEQTAFLGHRRDVFSIMKSSQVLALPSSREGMPNVVCEAMAADLPVVVSDIAPHTAFVTHERNGLVFDRRDPEALAQALTRVLRDQRLAERLVEGGKETALGLTVERMTRSYEEFYSSLVPRVDS